MKTKKTLILDEATWRCGGKDEIENRLGRGETMLRNYAGFMCCLGQFASQLNPEIKKSDLLSVDAPSCVAKDIPFLRNKITRRNTVLSDKAININDSTTTTVAQKVTKLKKLFARYGFKIVFKKKK